MIYYIGNSKNYEPLNKNIHFVDEFMCENIDIGFLSLVKDYYGACVPSKLYEYLNLEVPIIAALPEGDALDIINTKSYGKACIYDDIKGLKNIIKFYKDKN